MTSKQFQISDIQQKKWNSTKNCEYQRVSTVKICLKSATAANKKCLLFECRKKKFASPCTILRRFCPFVGALFRLQKFHLPVLKMPMYGRHWERPDTRIYDYNITGEHYYSKPPKPTYSSSLSELNRTSRSKQYFYVFNRYLSTSFYLVVAT